MIALIVKCRDVAPLADTYVSVGDSAHRVGFIVKACDGAVCTDRTGCTHVSAAHTT